MNRREAKTGFGDEIPKQVWAAARRIPREAHISKNLSGAEGRKSQGALARLCEFSMPEATIEIPVHFDRPLLLIPTGCALRWAQKDEGGILGFPPTSLWTPIPPPKRLRGISVLKNLRFSLNARVRRSRNCAFAP